MFTVSPPTREHRPVPAIAILILLVLALFQYVPGPVGTTTASGTGDIYSQSFEDGAGGWTHGGAHDEWELGSPAGNGDDPGPSGAEDGALLFGTDLDNTYDEGCDQWLLSPGFELYNLSSATLRFYLWYDLTLQQSNEPPFEDPVDELYLEISIDPAQNFTVIRNYNHTSAVENQWDQHVVSLDNWVNSKIWLRFRLVDEPQGYEDNGAYVDMVEITGERNTQYDAAPGPVIGKERLDVNEPATYRTTVENRGSLALDNITVRFEVTGTLENIIYSDERTIAHLDPGENVSTAFNWSSSDTGDFIVRVTTVHPEDEDGSNDEASISVKVVNIIYSTGFETVKDRTGWFGNSTGPATQWHPVQDSGMTHDGEWAFWCGQNSTGMYVSSSDDRLVSPLIDLSLMSGATLEFWHNFSFQDTTEPYDGGIIEAEQAGGNWTKLFPESGYNTIILNSSNCPIADQNAFGSGSQGWKKIVVDLDEMVGTSVRIAFRFCSDASVVDTGWIIDDLTIMGTPTGNCEPAEGTPPMISGLTVEDRGNGYIKVHWDASRTLDFDHYDVYSSSSPFSHTSGMTPYASITRRNQTYATVSGLDRTRTYYIGVTQVDSEGKENTTVNTVSAIPAEPASSNRDPLAVISGSLTDLRTGDTIYFHGEMSSDPDGLIVSYQWDFGDGSTTDREQPTHIYSEPGSYIISLVVTDDNGATNRTSITIRVNQASEPPASMDRNTLRLIIIFLVFLFAIGLIVVLLFYRRRRIGQEANSMEPVRDPDTPEDREPEDEYVVFSRGGTEKRSGKKDPPRGGRTNGPVNFSSLGRISKNVHRRTTKAKPVNGRASRDVVEPETVNDKKRELPRDVEYRETVTRPELLERINISITKVKCPECSGIIRVKVPSNMKGSDSISVECPHCGAKGEIEW